MTKNERQIREVFLTMLASYNALPAHQKKSRYLQITRIQHWLSEKVRSEVKAKMVVALFEKAGYEFVFEKGGFHHWVKVRSGRKEVSSIPPGRS